MTQHVVSYFVFMGHTITYRERRATQRISSHALVRERLVSGHQVWKGGVKWGNSTALYNNLGSFYSETWHLSPNGRVEVGSVLIRGWIRVVVDVLDFSFCRVLQSSAALFCLFQQALLLH